MNKIALILSISALQISSAFAASSGSQSVEDRISAGSALERQAVSVQQQIDKLAAYKRNLLSQATKSLTFQPNEILDLVQNSPNNLPDYCKMSVALEDGKLSTTIQSAKENKTVTSKVDSVSVDALELSGNQRKLWSYSGDLILLMDKSGTINKVIVSGKGGNVSCPYEKPFNCPACE